MCSLSEYDRDEISCKVCGEVIKRGEAAKSGCCNNTCRKKWTQMEAEEAAQMKREMQEMNNIKRGRICQSCGKEIEGPNMFWCRGCHGRIQDSWIYI